MNDQTTAAPRRRSLVVFALLGCGGLLACIVLAIAANAVFWTVRMGTASHLDGATPAAPVIESEAAALPPGDASRGVDLFDELGCANCHDLQGERGAGPSLAGVSGSTPDGYTPERFLYESIVAPDARVAPGFSSGIMPGHYGSREPQEIADLIAFLLEQ